LRNIENYQTLVIKVGSAVLTNACNASLDRGNFCRLVEMLARLRAEHKRVVLVTSGAVALGRSLMGMEKPDRRRSLPKLQALAAIGQSLLMQYYENEFRHYGQKVAQILLTRDDLEHRTRFANAKRTLATLLELGVVPIINENDSITTDEIRFGDNDALAARVAIMVRADLLVVLSDIDAIYTADPKVEPEAKPIYECKAMDESLDSYIGQTKSSVGSGGMLTKLEAARMAALSGISTIILNGKNPDNLRSGLNLKAGTMLMACEQAQRQHKLWLLSLNPHGRLFCDDGAYCAVYRQGKSLLPKGILRVEGNFSEGEAVELCGEDGKAFARGITHYSDADINCIKGQHSSEIHRIIGYHVSDTVVHRDDLVLLQ
jgi:glutamate 5-kinase